MTLFAASKPFVAHVKQTDADISLQEITCLSTQMHALPERKTSDMAQALKIPPITFTQQWPWINVKFYLLFAPSNYCSLSAPMKVKNWGIKSWSRLSQSWRQNINTGLYFSHLWATQRSKTISRVLMWMDKNAFKHYFFDPSYNVTFLNQGQIL